jgi:formate/nitrite transporter FocA (FNT family)
MPTVKGAEFWVITVLTYLIAAGDFTDVVAGSVEAFLLVFQAELSWCCALPCPYSSATSSAARSCSR